jgi:hypothetical protein
MKFGALFVVALLATCLSGCNITFIGAAKGIPGSGVSGTESRDVTGFDKISIVGFGKVNVTVGGEDSLSITGDDNLLELIESTVSNGKLTIKPSESIRPKTDMVFDISISRLTSVELSGAADFDIQNVEGDSLTVELNGSGNLDASGTVTKLNVEINGAGNVDLQQLEAETVTIEVNGAASGTVFARNSIDAEINGVGSVTVHGNPQDVKKQINGIGRFNVVD